MNFASQYAETLYKTSGIPIIITDRDTVVAYAGTSKKETADKKVSHEIEEIMESRQLYTYGGEGTKAVIDSNERIFASVCMPILSEGDLLGSVLLIAPEPMPAAGDVEYKLAQTIAAFLGRHMES